MNKSELIKALAEESNLPFDDASLVVNTFIDAMKDSLIAGDRIEIRGFESYKIKEYMPTLLETAQAQGYEFVTVSELLLEGDTIVDVNGVQKQA